MDVLDRIRKVETQPLHGTEAWVDLWETLQDARAEIERLRLTDAERRDLVIAADAYAENDDDPDCERIAATLRRLLERTKTVEN